MNTAQKAGVPVDDTETYADKSDVEELLRSYDIGTNTNLSESQLTSMLQKRTRDVEKWTTTAFRDNTVSGKKLDVHLSEQQKRIILGVRNRKPTRSGLGGSISRSPEKWVPVVMPHDRIQSIDSVKAYTSTGEPVTLDADEYRFNSRDGELEIDFRAFRNVHSGRFGSSLISNPYIEVDYTYGHQRVEEDITEAVTKLVVYDIVNSDAFGDVIPDEPDFVHPEDFTERIFEEAKETIKQYA